MGMHTFKSRRRQVAERVAVAGTIPLAMAVACAGTALAAPVQPGVMTDEAEQPGVGDSTPKPEAAPAPAPEPAPEPAEPRQYWVAPPVEYDNVPTRSVPTYDEAPVAPATVQTLHLPEPVAPVAPIEAPRDMLRLGDFIAAKPNWLSKEDMEKTNNSAAVAEAQMATFWRSIGIEASRSDKVAAATIAGATAGGLGAATVAGVPAAVVGGLIGGTIGGNIGMGMGTVVWPGVGTVTNGAIGTGIGAAAGAAVAGIPVAVVAGTAGAIVGGVAGAAFGAGDTSTEPVEFVIPDAPVVDPPAITAATRQAVAQVEAMPGGHEVVAAVRTAADAAPQQLAQLTADTNAQIGVVRTAAVAHPVGANAVAEIETVGADLGRAFQPATGAVADVLNAVHAGLAP
ncbi:insoluble domain protein [Rhodococcus spelaei]|uniref:Insoluble domain protein n=1 Tax=Rhodococcus spelaei TaxID=2546320 RepID=A0A541B9Q2_9NOCA|nr:insoluble domain protein [Rhodococcus spelaei]TQF69060.1 insoluble domain protein [Rhodococcus spelaei]